MHVQLSLVYQDAQQRVGDRLGGGPSNQGRVHANAWRIAFANDLVVVNHDNRLRVPVRGLSRLFKHPVQCGVECGIVGLNCRWPGNRPQQRRRGSDMGHNRHGGTGQSRIGGNEYCRAQLVRDIAR